MQETGQTYQEPIVNQQYIIQEQVAPVVSVKEWLISFLILLIPIVNIVMMFVWAFGGGNPSKANFFKASLIWAAIITILYVVIFVLILGSLATALS
ncbi:hypothetical protein [Paenibacillus endoradicis]|uniref:hypothetical protein n=1 Tax=Paenibacillus endoradicis TaxID=2972487 RepID=UPI0021590FE7|nr:hypothetical protein [Paenibacillus endoradicis]MCR8659367.1 hypothetical protein [Paenibacillus endoradicis]